MMLSVSCPVTRGTGLNSFLMSKIKLPDGSNLHPIVEQILLNRGISDPVDLCRFLSPKLSELPVPFLLKDMDIAVGLICESLVVGKNFLIWGDYDVDGTTATALLVKFFSLLNKEVTYHIPNRLSDGYGLQKDSLARITEGLNPKETVLITVDNGISAHQAVDYARSIGYTVVVTDHHTPPDSRVHAHAVINPNQNDCPFPDKDLAGVGVAFYLTMGVRAGLLERDYFTDQEIPNLKALLDLVAVGTVADMVQLGKVNRILVKAGLEVIADGGNQGLTALCRKANLDTGLIRSEDISFQLAPKINAAGRLGNAGKAVELFLASSKKDANILANSLLVDNEKRRFITLDNYANAEHEVKATEKRDVLTTVVVAGNYHVGVAGIVASKLVESYLKPSVVLCDVGDGLLKGSARSVPGVDLYKVLHDCRDVLLGFGGHPMAGGMSIKSNNVNMFKLLFETAVKSQEVQTKKSTEGEFDIEVEVGELFKGIILRQLHMMEPFGQGNPQPIFCDRQSSFSELSQVGKDKDHLRFVITQKQSRVQGVAFGFGHDFDKCRNNLHREILYTPSINFFRGKRSWQVRVVGIGY